MRAQRSLISLCFIAAVGVAVGCNNGDGGEEAASVASAPAQERERGGQDEFGPYEPVETWPQPLPDRDDGVTHEGWTWGSTAAVWAETPDRIWIGQRGELPLPEGAKPWTPYGMLRPPRGATGFGDGLTATCDPAPKRGWERRWHHMIFVVDRNGMVVQEWPHLDKMFASRCGRGPHRIKMNPHDPEKHVWIVDDQQHVIWKFTYDGKLVMTLGTLGQRGRDGGNLFDRPTDIDWLPDGTFFITDGYGGTRVAKFDRDGKFIKDWGGPPKDPKNPGPYEFATPHSVAISRDRRLFVADREHHRFQIFDEDGKFLDMFSTGRYSFPYDHFISSDQYLWVADGGTSRILKYDLDGHYLDGWGMAGEQPGQFHGSHQISTDQEGNLYVAEVFTGRAQKFRPKPNADRARLVGQEAPVAEGAN